MGWPISNSLRTSLLVLCVLVAEMTAAENAESRNPRADCGVCLSLEHLHIRLSALLHRQLESLLTRPTTTEASCFSGTSSHPTCSPAPVFLLATHWQRVFCCISLLDLQDTTFHLYQSGPARTPLNEYPVTSRCSSSGRSFGDKLLVGTVPLARDCLSD